MYGIAISRIIGGYTHHGKLERKTIHKGNLNSEFGARRKAVRTESVPSFNP
tara:strand:+ start:348 stop:500 length:153 start_codon:yes stop_codon:yes gene_type:complete